MVSSSIIVSSSSKGTAGMSDTLFFENTFPVTTGEVQLGAW